MHRRALAQPLRSRDEARCCCPPPPHLSMTCSVKCETRSRWQRSSSRAACTAASRVSSSSLSRRRSSACAAAAAEAERPEGGKTQSGQKRQKRIFVSHKWAGGRARGQARPVAKSIGVQWGYEGQCPWAQRCMRGSKRGLWRAARGVKRGAQRAAAARTSRMCSKCLAHTPSDTGSEAVILATRARESRCELAG